MEDDYNWEVFVDEPKRGPKSRPWLRVRHNRVSPTEAAFEAIPERYDIQIDRQRCIFRIIRGTKYEKRDRVSQSLRGVSGAIREMGISSRDGSTWHQTKLGDGSLVFARSDSG